MQILLAFLLVFSAVSCGEKLYTPGTCEGAAPGIHGKDVIVEVSMDKKEIKEIKIIQNEETPGLSDATFERIPKVIIDGQILAEQVEAALIGLEHIQLLPLGDPETGSLSGNIEQGVENRIFVNKDGKRFVDEGARRDVMTMAGPIWRIPLRNLPEKIDVNPDNLKTAVAEFNAAALILSLAVFILFTWFALRRSGKPEYLITEGSKGRRIYPLSAPRCDSLLSGAEDEVGPAVWFHKKLIRFVIIAVSEPGQYNGKII